MRFKTLIPILLTIGLLSTSCAALRGIGLSDAGVDGIRDILVGEVAVQIAEDFCDRPVDKRIELARTLSKAGVDLTTVEC